jgi:glutamine cyclotransferase
MQPDLNLDLTSLLVLQPPLQSLTFFLVGVGFELVLARQVLYHMSHASSSFYSGYLQDRVSLFAQTGKMKSSYLCFSTVAEMTGMCHHA